MSHSDWYKELAKALKEAKPRPKTDKQVQILFKKILFSVGHQNVQIKELLNHYHISAIHATTTEVSTSTVPTSLPDGVQFEWNTLPVDPKKIGDGDGGSVYISVADPEESSKVPSNVLIDAMERLKSQAVERLKPQALRTYEMADSKLNAIKTAGYNVIRIDNEEYLARKYRIRLRGIDAPEMGMPFGEEAKAELTNLVQHKCLKLSIYNEDHYGRFVCDVHCDDIFVQEHMLINGFAWHYRVHDQRPDFKLWENEAQQNKAGLWALANPEPPWTWRRREGK